MHAPWAIACTSTMVKLQHFFPMHMMKKNQTGKRPWSVLTHVIWPLIFFAAGILVAMSILGGHVPEDASKLSSGTQTRLVEMMGRVNDLENTINDLEMQLAESRKQRDDLEKDLESMHRKLKAAEDAIVTGPISELGEEESGDHWKREAEAEAEWAALIAAQGDSHANVKWSKVGKWQATQLEPLSFIQKFDIGLPTETIKWSGGILLLPESIGGKHGLKDIGTALDNIQHQCSELDVLVLNDLHCVALTHVNGNAAGHNTPYHISRFLKGGYKSKGRRSDKPVIAKDDWEFVSRLTSKSGSNEGAPPGQYSLKVHRSSLSRFLNSVDEVESKLRPILQKAAKDNVVMTMTMNAGMTDMILNFVCSARKAGTSIDHLVLFPTDDEAVAVAQSLGIAYFTHPSFGDFPKEEAATYGDNTFVKMMWIKVLCVYLPVNLGFHVLFQDADVVWFRDPIKEYFMKPEISGDFDVYFQDDGSRSTRFSPYFANSGFYFLRQSPRTKYFMTMLLYEGDQILEWRSHQSALVQILADASSKFGLKVKTLSFSDFPSGKDYHHRKPYMEQWLHGDVHPYAFHMCWTQNKVDKVKYLKQLGGWFMHTTCNEDSIRSPKQLAGSDSLADACCSAEPVVECFYRDKASKGPCNSSPNKDKGASSWWP